MESKLWILNLFSFLNILRFSGTYGVNFRAYGRENFTELFWHSASTANCTNLPSHKRNIVYSVKTDTCFVGYNDPNCKSYHSMKYMPGDTHNLPKKLYLASLHICNETEGGSQLNVDLTGVYNDINEPPKVLKSFKNVCSCVNIPEFVQILDRWSMDNHHNDLLAYYEPDCSVNKWSPEFIAAGHRRNSTDIYNFMKTDNVTKIRYKIQSFGPLQKSSYYQTSCTTGQTTTEYRKAAITENPQSLQTNTERIINEEADVVGPMHILTTKNIKLQIEIDQTKINQCNFQTEIERLLKQLKIDFDQLTEKISKQEQLCKNFTEKIKSDLHEIFA